MIIVADGQMTLNEVLIGTQSTRTYIREFQDESCSFSFNNSQRISSQEYSDLIKKKLLIVDITEEPNEEKLNILQTLFGIRLLRHSTTVIILNETVVNFKTHIKEFISDNNYGHRNIGMIEGTPRTPFMTGALKGYKPSQYFSTDPLATILSAEDKIDFDKYKHIGFLDIDGVLQYKRTYIRTGGRGTLPSDFLKEPWKVIKGYDQEAMTFLSKFSYHFGVKWVLSSTHRYTIKDKDLEMWSKFVDIPIIDITGHNDRRELEISDYIQKHPISGQFLVLDDEISNDFEWRSNTLAVKVDYINGLSYQQMQLMTNFLDVDNRSVFHSLISDTVNEPIWMKVE